MIGKFGAEDERKPGERYIPRVEHLSRAVHPKPALPNKTHYTSVTYPAGRSGGTRGQATASGRIPNQ